MVLGRFLKRRNPMKFQAYTTIIVSVLLGFVLRPVPGVCSGDREERDVTEKNEKTHLAAHCPARGLDEFDKLLYVFADDYDGDIPGNHKNLSGKKWYFAIGLFRDKKLIEARSFPASLLIKDADFEKSKPTWIGFMPKEQEMLTIEWEGLVKYTIRADWNIIQKKPWFSVDFGKRLVIAPRESLDPEFMPFGDDKGNIFFKKKDGKYYKWISKKETIKELDKEPERPKEKRVRQARIEDDGVRVGDMKLSFDAALKNMDPLVVDEDRLVAAHKGYGTKENPVSERDYKDVIHSTLIDPGKLLALSKLLEVGDEIVSKIHDDRFETFMKHLADMCKTATGKKGTIRELKLLMREEGGVTSGLKKTENVKMLSVQEAREMMLTGDNLIKAKMMFDAVKGYDGVKWFDDVNQNPTIKAYFVYLASLDDKELDTVMKIKLKLMSLIARMKLKSVVNTYKLTNEFRNTLKE